MKINLTEPLVEYTRKQMSKSTDSFIKDEKDGNIYFTRNFTIEGA